MKLNLARSLFNDAFFPLLKDYTHRWEAYCGSAGSGKSYHITQKLILRALTEPIRILVCRRYGTTIRQTVFSLFKEVIAKWQLTPFVKINEGDYRITFPNDSQIIFTGLDEETKLLSLNNISTVWCEEAYEIPRDMIEQLNLRMRGQLANQQIIMSWNPISKTSWLYDFVTKPPESFIFHHSTFKDNKFLSKEYIDALEDLRVRNPKKAQVYYYGEWGTDVDGLVLTNWHVEDFDIDVSTLEHRPGLDEGFTDPTAIVDSFYDKEHNRIYITQEFYKSGQTLDQIHSAIERMHLNKSKIYCDSASPRLIDYLKRHYIAAYPCLKGQGSVDARISFLQNQEIIVKPTCVNVIRELENFSYEKDKNTGKYIDGKYTHEFSHSIDALGYGYSDLYTKQRLKTLDKGALGL